MKLGLFLTKQSVIAVCTILLSAVVPYALGDDAPASPDEANASRDVARIIPGSGLKPASLSQDESANDYEESNPQRLHLREKIRRHEMKLSRMRERLRQREARLVEMREELHQSNRQKIK